MHAECIYLCFLPVAICNKRLEILKKGEFVLKAEHQLLVSTDDVNSWGPKNTGHKKTESLLYVTKKAGLEVEAKKTK